jgi:hypothetical protein
MMQRDDIRVFPETQDRDDRRNGREEPLLRRVGRRPKDYDQEYRDEKKRR